MKKEDLIISLLKSKESIAELFNDKNNDNNNNNNNDNNNNNHHHHHNNNLYNNEISDIRRILSRLRDMLPKKYIKDKLYKIEHQRNISEAEKEENDEYLRQLVRILNDKEEHSLYDRDVFDYYGIRDIENLFDEASEEGFLFYL